MKGAMLIAMKETRSPNSPLSETSEERSKRLDGEAVTEALNRVYNQEESSLDPFLAALQVAMFAREDE
jgi:hypothetical protein